MGATATPRLGSELAVIKAPRATAEQGLAGEFLKAYEQLEEEFKLVRVLSTSSAPYERLTRPSRSS